MALWSRIFGLVGGGAVAGAAAGAVEPVLEGIRQDAWNANAIRVLAAEIAAQAVAQQLLEPGDAHAEGSAEGISNVRMDHMIRLAQTAPDAGTLIELLRREFINPGNFDEGRKKAALEDKWLDPLLKLKDSILSPADLANAVQQGFIPDAGLLPGGTGGSPPFNPPVTQVGISTLKEFEHSGYSADRAKVMAELTGLPPGPGELMQMLNRNIITDTAFYTGIREGHTKTKWADALKYLRFEILSPIQAANLRLRGWIKDPEMYALGKLAGADENHMHRLWQMQGRPPGPAQLQTAVNRKLILFPEFEKGIQESDVRDEWTQLLYDMRVRYPTPFALRQLASSKILTIKEVADILELEGYPKDLAVKMATGWAAGSTAKQKELAQMTIETLYEARYIDAGQAGNLLTQLGYDANEITLILELGDAQRVKRFLDAAVGRIHTKFVSHRLPGNIAVQELNALNISQQAIADLMAEWTLERDVNVPGLTAGQYASAVYYEIMTRQAGIDGIKSLGYSDEDAKILVDIRMHGPPSPGTV
jgi:hypothetical protein